MGHFHLFHRYYVKVSKCTMLQKWATSATSGRTWMWLEFGPPSNCRTIIWWIPSCLAPPKQNHAEWVLDQHLSIAYFDIFCDILWWMNIHKIPTIWYENQGCMVSRNRGTSKSCSYWVPPLMDPSPKKPRLALMHANGSRIVCLVVPPALISLSRSVLQMLGWKGHQLQVLSKYHDSSFFGCLSPLLVAQTLDTRIRYPKSLVNGWWLPKSHGKFIGSDPSLCPGVTRRTRGTASPRWCRSVCRPSNATGPWTSRREMGGRVDGMGQKKGIHGLVERNILTGNHSFSIRFGAFR